MSVRNPNDEVSPGPCAILELVVRLVSPTVRPDDVLKPLLPVLEVAPKLREYLARNKLSQKYWYERFGELIIDRLWKELTGGAKGGGNG